LANIEKQTNTLYMKKLVKILLVVIAVFAVIFFVLKNFTKKASPEATANFTSSDLSVMVNYSQPSVKGRTIFGDVVPFDQVWRTGANEPTTITFSRDVKIEGQTLAAGKYALWTVPTADKWTIIFNSDIPFWGVTYEAETNVLEVEVHSSQTVESVEMFNVSFVDVDSAGINMNLNWDKTSVTVLMD
jgi:hypothetical protein